MIPVKKEESLRLSLIQSNILWEQPQGNCAQFEKKILDQSNDPHLIVLPEMFNTGFSMQAQKYAETMEGETVSWLKNMASRVSADIAGSLIIKDNDDYFNRLIWAKPDGQIFHYDKRHLFRMAGEDKAFSAGTKRMLVDIKGWKVLPLICYDLRFPVWARNKQNEFDLILYVANWPRRRIDHWTHLLRCRAIENQCYVAGVNRTGHDGRGVYHSGQSALYDYMGTCANERSSNDKIYTLEIARSGLDNYRQKFPVWQDADFFEIL